MSTALRLQAQKLLRIPAKSKADIFCCQEIKIRCPLSAPGRLWFWNPAKRPGDAGALDTGTEGPMRYGMGIGPFDDEGRLILLEYNVATFCF